MERMQKKISKDVAAKVTQPMQQSTGSAASFQFKDNRKEAETQQNIQSLADHSSIQLKQADSDLQKKSNTTGMPDKLKSGVENLSGIDMSDVKVHYNSAQPAQLNAHAYAQGTDIHIAPGQEKHLPHEAWHVVQQKQGRVKPTMQMKKGVAVNDDKALEKEADVMGAKAVQMKIQSNQSEDIYHNPIQLQSTEKHNPEFVHNNVPVIQRFLTIGKKGTEFHQYKDFDSIPLQAQQTINEVALSNKKYEDIKDWIKEWSIYLRMEDEKDKVSLTKSLDKVLSPKGTDLDPVKKTGKVYGLGSVPLLPGGAKGGRPLSSSIQDDLNNAVVGGKDKDLKGPEANEYAAFLDNSKYKPAGQREKGKQFDTKNNSDFKKLCKAGIVFHTKGRKDAKTVHFELSGLDMYEVVSKIDGGGSITKAELRSVYRQYLVQLSGEEPTIDLTNVKFYFLGKQVPPPWIEDPGLWELYKPKFHEKKNTKPTSSGSWISWQTAASVLLVAVASILIYKNSGKK